MTNIWIEYFNTDSDPEDNNIQKINNELLQIENKSLENINDLNELIGLEPMKEKWSKYKTG